MREQQEQLRLLMQDQEAAEKNSELSSPERAERRGQAERLKELHMVLAKRIAEQQQEVAKQEDQLKALLEISEKNVTQLAKPDVFALPQPSVARSSSPAVQ
eukprot:tig00001336_g8220.t1